MAAKTIVKLVALVIITILAIVAVFGGRISYAKNKKKNEQEGFKRMVRLRMICFVAMMVLVLICLII